MEPAHARNLTQWFGRSAVVNADGSPKVVYHGTDGVFSRFSSSYCGTNRDSFRGEGFYFTDKAHDAARYGSEIMQVYLKIVKPAVLSGNLVADMTSFGLLHLVPKGSDVSLGSLVEAKERIKLGLGVISSSAGIREWFTDYRAEFEGQPYFIRSITKEEAAAGEGYIRDRLATRILWERFQMTDPDNLGLVGTSFNPSELVRELGVKGYDGIISDGADILSLGCTEFVVFNPGQIKSAVGNCGQFNPGNPDIYR